MSMGKVYLVGAGCGDANLITVRGMNILQSCDTVIYDNLIDIRLLDHVSEKAEKICVGKRAGHHSESQENINEIIVRKALQGKTVVRLKGGDPFVFGRGGEEISCLRENNIPYSLIPGVSSAIAVPELAGIPVTHRSVSRSFHVITGHTADEILPKDLEKYASLNGTLVFLMGLGNIRKITDGLISGGMKSNTPAAVISCGGTLAQHTVKGDLQNIADVSDKEKVLSPAVIVIGETASLDFSPTLKEPLDGVSVYVTGTKCFADKLSEKLGSLGAYIKRLDYLKINEYDDNRDFDNALEHISDYKIIAFTSINGAEIFFKRLTQHKLDIRCLQNIKIAVIGKGTAEAFEKRGIFPNITPEKFTSLALGEEISKHIQSREKVLILRAEKGSAELTEVFERNNILYDEIKTYDVEKTAVNSDKILIDTDFITFASSSGVKAFFESGFDLSHKTRIVCIGEITAETLKKYGADNFISSEVHTAEGLVSAILMEVGK